MRTWKELTENEKMVAEPVGVKLEVVYLSEVVAEKIVPPVSVSTFFKLQRQFREETGYTSSGVTNAEYVYP